MLNWSDSSYFLESHGEVRRLTKCSFPLQCVLEQWMHLVEQQSAHTEVKNAILKSCILTAVSWYWALFSKVHFLSRFGAQLLALQLGSGHGKHTIKQRLMNLCGPGAAVFNNSLSTLSFLHTAQDYFYHVTQSFSCWTFQGTFNDRAQQFYQFVHVFILMNSSCLCVSL